MTTATPSAMGGSSQAQAATRPERVATTERTGWTGWIAFAGALMILLGILGVIQGVVALVNDSWTVWTNTGAVLVDLTAWGWVHIALSVVLILSGLGLFTGNLAARVIAVAVAALSLIVNFAFLPAYPVWSLTIIALDVVVIWAVIVHGSEMREPA